MLGRFGVAVWPRVLALLLAVCLLSGCDFGAKPKTKTTKKKTAASRPGEPLSWPNMPMGDTVASGGSGPDTGSAPGNGSGHDNRSVNSPPVSAFAPATYSIGAIPAGGPAEPATAFFDHDLFPVETARLERQTAPLSDVKYSSDGGAILTLTEDGEVRVVDASSRAVVRSIRPFGVLGGETFIRGNALAVRPDGKQIAVAAGDKIQLLAIGEDAPPKVIEGIKPPIKDLEYSADGQRLLALEGEHCATWNLDGRRLITGVDAVPIEFYAEFLNISPDGGLIAIEKDGVVTVYDVGGGAIVKRLDAALPHMDAAVFSPNGKMLAVAAGDWGKKTISVFEWPTGKLLHTVTPKDSLTGMAFLRDGRTLVADGFLVYLIDAPTGRVLYEGPRDTGASTAYFAVNPRCDEFIELKHGAMDELVIHALQPSPELKTLRTPEPKNEASIRLAGSSDGASLAAADGKRIFIWNAESAELIADVAAEADAFTFAADGARLFTNESYKTVARNSAGGAPQGEPIDSLQPLHTVPKTNLIVQRNSEQQLVLVDLASPGESRSLGGPQESSAIDYVAHVAYSADGHWAAISNGRLIEAWDLTAKTRLKTLQGDRRGLLDLAVSNDGRYLAILPDSEGRHLWLWEITTGVRTLQWKAPRATEAPTTIEFVGDHLVAGSVDGRLRLWNPATRQIVSTVLAHPDDVAALVRLGESGRFATADERPSRDAVKIWDVAELVKPSAADKTRSLPEIPRELTFTTGRPSLELPFSGVSSESWVTIQTVAVSPNGKWIAAGGGNSYRSETDATPNRVRVWNAETLEVAHTLDSPKQVVRRLCFSSDGERLASVSAGPQTTTPMELHSWSLTTGAELPVQTVDKPDDELQTVMGGTELLTVLDNDELLGWNPATLKSRVISRESFFGADAAAFSRDGKRIALAGGSGWAFVISAQTGAQEMKFQTEFATDSLDFDAEGRRLAMGGSNSLGSGLRVWDLETGELMLDDREIRRDGDAVAYSPDGRWLAVSESGDWLHLFDAKTLKRARLVKLESGMCSSGFAFTPDGKTLVMAGIHDVGVWRMTDLLDLAAEEKLAHLDEVGFRIGELRGRTSTSLWLERAEDVPLLKALEGTPIESLTIGSGDLLTEDSLKVLLKMPHLKELLLAGPMPSQCLRDATAVPSLEELTFSDCQPTEGWTPALMQSVVAGPRLRKLEFNQMRGFTNQLLEPISQASKLTSLTLPEMNADDETVKLLARLTNLTKLNLQSVDLSNADASPLAACTKLEVLDLSETNLGDAGMATIGKLTNLVEITLPKTLTDAGLEILAKLPRLRNASLYRCESLSDGAVAKLKAARPDLRIGR